MDEKKAPTVEFSLTILSDAIGKAEEDLRIAREAVDRARVDISTRNTSLSRDIIRDAERVVDELRKTDESLQTVVRDLIER